MDVAGPLSPADVSDIMEQGPVADTRGSSAPSEGLSCPHTPEAASAADDPCHPFCPDSEDTQDLPFGTQKHKVLQPSINTRPDDGTEFTDGADDLQGSDPESPRMSTDVLTQVVNSETDTGERSLNVVEFCDARSVNQSENVDSGAEQGREALAAVGSTEAYENRAAEDAGEELYSSNPLQHSVARHMPENPTCMETSRGSETKQKAAEDSSGSKDKDSTELMTAQDLTSEKTDVVTPTDPEADSSLKELTDHDTLNGCDPECSSFESAGVDAHSEDPELSSQDCTSRSEIMNNQQHDSTEDDYDSTQTPSSQDFTAAQKQDPAPLPQTDIRTEATHLQHRLDEDLSDDQSVTVEDCKASGVGLPSDSSLPEIIPTRTVQAAAPQTLELLAKLQQDSIDEHLDMAANTASDVKDSGTVETELKNTSVVENCRDASRPSDLPSIGMASIPCALQSVNEFSDTPAVSNNFSGTTEPVEDEFSDISEPGNEVYESTEPEFSDSSEPVNGFSDSPEPVNGFSDSPEPVNGFSDSPEPVNGFSDSPEPVNGFSDSPEPVNGYADSPEALSEFSDPREPGKQLTTDVVDVVSDVPDTQEPVADSKAATSKATDGSEDGTDPARGETTRSKAPVPKVQTTARSAMAAELLSKKLPEIDVSVSAKVTEVPSELSPYAEPFMPRDPSAQLTANTTIPTIPTTARFEPWNPFQSAHFQKTAWPVDFGQQRYPVIGTGSCGEARLRHREEQSSSLAGSRFGHMFQKPTAEPVSVPPACGFSTSVYRAEAAASMRPIGFERERGSDCCSEEAELSITKDPCSHDSAAGGICSCSYPGLRRGGCSLSGRCPPGKDDALRCSRTLKSSVSSTDSSSVTDSSEDSGDYPHTGASPLHTVASDASLSDLIEAELSEATDVDSDDSLEGDTTLLAEAKPERLPSMDVPELWTSFKFAEVWGPHQQTESSQKVTPWSALLQKESRPSAVDREAAHRARHHRRGQEAKRKGAGHSAMEEDTSHTRLSADSGFASLSDPSTVGSVSDSDSSPKSSAACVPVCQPHRQPVTAYCRDSCELLCAQCLTHHADCQRVLDLGLACRDVKYRLLKVQGRIDTHIHALTEKAAQLQPELEKLAKRRQEAKSTAEGIFGEVIQTMRDKFELRLKSLDDSFAEVDKRLMQKKQKSEHSVALLREINQLLHVLRQQDSGLDLLSAFHPRLSCLLEQVLQTKESTHSKLIDLLDVTFSGFRPSPKQGMVNELENQSEQELRSRLNAAGDAGRAKEWVLTYSEHLSTTVGSAEQGGGSSSVQPERDTVSVMRELKDTLYRCCSELAVRDLPGSAMLFSTVENITVTSPADFLDDVFLYEAKASDCPSEVFTRRLLPRYRLQHRIPVVFPGDTKPAYVTDLHVTETKFLVFLDAGNSCLKRYHLHQAAKSPARLSLKVPQPLGMCSAGWNRVMVSCGGRGLKVVDTGLQEQLKVVTQRTTQHQYRGLVRASDALVAAACPETGSVDLLDLYGQVIRVLKPVEFGTGPEVVGVTKQGELLVVNHPLHSPTTILCFDMGGKELWSSPLPSASRHISCCKVVGGEDGYVYVAVTGDSTLYRVDPALSTCEMVFSYPNISLPSSMAVTSEGDLIVTQNELPNVEPTAVASNSRPMLPITNEIDIFVCQQQDSAK